MYNFFLINSLVVLFFLTSVINASSQSIDELNPNRSIDLHQLIEEELYHCAINLRNNTLIIPESYNKEKLLSVISLRLPETSYAIESSNYELLNDPVISAAIVSMIHKDLSDDVLGTNESTEKQLSGIEFSQADYAMIQFIYGYNLFKEKRYTEAREVLLKSTKRSSANFEYAYYYMGLASMLEGKYVEAISHFLKIKKEKSLIPYMPYYLAGSHYALKDLNEIIRYYAERLNDRQIYNRSGLIKIVAFTYFQKSQWTEVIATLNDLKNIRDLTQDEKYLLAISNKNSGKNEISNLPFEEIVLEGGKYKANAQYELAMSYYQQGEWMKSITAFEKLIYDNHPAKNEILWNLLLLNQKTGNSDKCISLALNLLNSPFRSKATKVLFNQINLTESQLDNIYVQLKSNPDYKEYLTPQLYNMGLVKFKEGNKAQALKYFDDVLKLNPEIRLRTNVAAWKGIIDYEDGKYKDAKNQLETYYNSMPNNSNNRLDFDAIYFLAYSHLKLGDADNSYSLFNKSLQNLQNSTKFSDAEKALAEEDIYLRMGDCKFIKSDYTKASNYYKNAYKLGNKQRDYTLNQLAVLSELNGKPYEVIVLLEELVSNYKTSRFSLNAKFNLANTLFSIGQYEKSSRYYKAIISGDNDNKIKEESTLQLALINVNAGNYPEAENLYKQLIIKSSSAHIKNRAASSLKEIYSDYTYDPESYVSISSEMDETISKDQLIFELGKKYQSDNKFKEAQDQYRKLIIDFPKSPKLLDALNGLATIYSSQNNVSEYIETLIKITSLPTNEYTSSAFNKLEDFYYSNKDYEKYLNIRSKRSDSFPLESRSNNANDRMLYATIYSSNSYINEDVIKVVTGSVYSDSDKYNLLSRIVENTFYTKDYLKLITLLENKDVSQLLNQYPKLIYMQALSNMNLNNYNKTIECISGKYDFLLKDPAWLAKSILLISDAYYLNNNPDAATAALEALIDSETSFPGSLKEQAKLRLNKMQLAN